MKQNIDIGFVLIKLANDPMYDTILNTIKEIEQNNLYGQTLIFNSYNEKINTYNLPILHLSQAQFFYGNLFVFDLSTVILSKNFPNVKSRILYTNNAPWTVSPSTRYSEWASLYEQKNLEILPTNKELYDIYDICWKKPIGILEDFTYEKIKCFL